MNRIPAQVALLSALVAVTLTACATTTATPAASPTPTPTNIYAAVWQNWDGDPPDEQWIDTAALLTCKQIIGGIEPRVTDDPGNNEVMVSAAEDYLCEVTR